ncbi:DNA-3-methyladenine glycosylase II [hydrothermal vent metagenome]|uniref:DNA-3-methyladenine glycosylase II n=1 Tax=hydrothermal vent metagenome TaxID=652676 RepID=A0A160VHZ1_9ZZZZ
MKKAGCKSMFARKTKPLSIKKAVKYLMKSDPELIPLLDAFKIQDLQPETDYFKSLTRSIVYQQLSGKAAKTILDRFILLYKDKSYPTPVDVINIDHEKLRSVGLSNSKAQYIKNIAHAFLDNPDTYDSLEKMDDQDIIDTLITIKGVGPWTAQMFLMFTLNRPDVFPVTDLGVQKGFQHYYKLSEMPTPGQMLKKSEQWAPYRTVVSLYFWRLLEGPFEW